MKNKNLYKELHTKDNHYGTTGGDYYDVICMVIDYLKPKTVLDYGCGKGILIKKLGEKYTNIKFYGYDPAIEGINKLELEKVDLIINTDVLEHIPEEEINNTIKEISKISQNVFFGLHHALAYTTLANNENAHCTVKPVFWYYNLLMPYFKNLTILSGRNEYISLALTFPLYPDFFVRYKELMKPHFTEKCKHFLEWIFSVKNIWINNNKIKEICICGIRINLAL